MVIGAAFQDASAHPLDENVGTYELRYSNRYMDAVDLVVTPTERGMTWETWGFASLGIGSFVQRWEYVELTFDVLIQDVGRVGSGMLFQEERADLVG